MLLSSSLHSGMKYVQEQYQDLFVEPYIKSFILEMNNLSNYKGEVEGYLNKELFRSCLENLEYTFNKRNKNGEKYNSTLIIILCSLYITAIKEEPLHPAGSVFPGRLKVYEEDAVFYCPVKDAQKDNPNTLCTFCIAKQTPNIK